MKMTWKITYKYAARRLFLHQVFYLFSMKYSIGINSQYALSLLYYPHDKERR